MLNQYVTKYTEKSEVRAHEALVVGGWPKPSGCVVKTAPQGFPCLSIPIEYLSVLICK